MCRDAEKDAELARRRKRIANIIINIGLGVSFTGALDSFIIPWVGFSILGVGALIVIVGSVMHEIEHIVRDQV